MVLKGIFNNLLSSLPMIPLFLAYMVLFGYRGGGYVYGKRRLLSSWDFWPSLWSVGMSYYVIIKIEVPYPSIADIGYFVDSLIAMLCTIL